MRIFQILLLLLSLLSLSLAASIPSSSGSAPHSTGGKTSSQGGTRKGSQRQTGRGKSKEDPPNTLQPNYEQMSYPDENSGGETPEIQKDGEPKTDDGPDDGTDGTPTDTREDASETIAAQEERSTTIEAEADEVSTPTSPFIATSARASSEETVTTQASGAGMDSADMSLLGLLVAVGMGVLVY